MHNIYDKSLCRVITQHKTLFLLYSVYYIRKILPCSEFLPCRAFKSLLKERVMTAQKQISGETDKALRHLLDVLLRAIYKTTAGSAKFLVYLVCSIAVLNIIGYEQISTLNIQPAIYYIIQGVLASPLINRLVEQLAGDLLANRIENVINNSQSDKEILKLIGRLVKENEL